MKRIIIIIFSFVFLSNNVLANDNYLNEFNKWLLDNGHTQYLNIEQKAVCKKFIQQYGLKVPKVGLVDEPKYKSMEWFHNKCHEPQATNNLKIKFFKSSEIPWGTKPNKDTLLYYLFTYINTEDGFDRAGSKGSKNPYKFKTELRDDKISKYIKKHMQKTALLSYLLYEDGKITIDEISPKNRFGILFDNNTQFTSMSVGKSIVFYVTGHAICKGHIDSVDTKLNDWPLLKNTLFLIAKGLVYIKFLK